MSSYAALYSTNVAALYAAASAPGGGGSPIGLLLALTYASGGSLSGQLDLSSTSNSGFNFLVGTD